MDLQQRWAGNAIYILCVVKAVILLITFLKGDVSQREGLMAARKQDSENDVIVLVGGFVPSDTVSNQTLRGGESH